MEWLVASTMERKMNLTFERIIKNSNPKARIQSFIEKAKTSSTQSNT